MYLLEIHTSIDTNEINDIEVEINRHTITTFTYDEQPIRATAGVWNFNAASCKSDIWHLGQKKGGICYEKNIMSQRQICLKNELTIYKVSLMLGSLVVNLLLVLYKIPCFQCLPQ